MKLSEFPNIVHAFTCIMQDSGCGRHHKLKPDTVVPGAWEKAFQLTEVILGQFRYEPVSTFTRNLHPDVKDDDNAFEVIILPPDDAGTDLMRAAHVDPEHAKVVDDLLYQFFDGDLHGYFTS